MSSTQLDLRTALETAPAGFGTNMEDAFRLCNLLGEEAVALTRAGKSHESAALALRFAERYPGNSWVANSAATVIAWHCTTHEDPDMVKHAIALSDDGAQAFTHVLHHHFKDRRNVPPFVLTAFLPKSGGTYITRALEQRYGYDASTFHYACGTPEINFLQRARVKAIQATGGVLNHIHLTPSEFNFDVIRACAPSLWVHLRDPRDAFCSLMTMVQRERERADYGPAFYRDAETSTGINAEDLMRMDIATLVDVLWERFEMLCRFIAAWSHADLPGMFVTWHADLAASEENFFQRIEQTFGIKATAATPGLPKKDYATTRFHSGTNGRWRRVFDDSLQARMTDTMTRMGILELCETGGSATRSPQPTGPVTASRDRHAVPSMPGMAEQTPRSADCVNPSLIFDIGLHTGRDTDFYLQKGFRVVAVEANPAMAERTRALLHEHIAKGTLTIVEKAVHEDCGRLVSFFVNDEKDDWSSLERSVAEKGVTTSREVFVETINLATLFANHGVPYYLKCDIEGGDLSVATQLMSQPVRPTFASFEITSISLLAALWAAGYRRFQLVNQAFNHLTRPPEPALEGTFAARLFDGHSSGLFGRELPRDRWVDVDELAALYLDFVRLRSKHPQLCMGWLDVHATT